MTPAALTGRLRAPWERPETSSRSSQARSTSLLERLAASLRHEQRLSAEISHELRTPLANIIAEAQYALRHGQHIDDANATLEHILQSARQLGRTLDTLMAAARAQLDPHRATSDSAACAHTALQTSVPKHISSQLEITVDSPQDRLRVAVERELVERILAPLLENATRHARHLVHIGVEGDREAVRFVLQDDGPGVPAEEQEAIFQPGYRATTSAPATTITSPGTGLGLALCRRLARTAGGDVLAEPSDAGARFIVRLPAAGCSPAVAQRRSTAKQSLSSGERTVLAITLGAHIGIVAIVEASVAIPLAGPVVLEHVIRR